MRKTFFALFIIVVFGSCSKEQGPRIPSPVTLIFPEENSECISGVSITEQTSAVTFTWNPSNPAAYYVLNVYTLNGDLVSTSNEIDPQGTVVLDKGFGYAWEVIAANALGEESDPSERWLFYNAGAQRSYPPFPPEIQFPGSGATLQLNTNGSIPLLWSGADADHDLETFEIWVGATPEFMELQAVLPATATRYELVVPGGSRYFWQVVSEDARGNSSFSGIYDFRVL
jgi:hypothetical protein